MNLKYYFFLIGIIFLSGCSSDLEDISEIQEEVIKNSSIENKIDEQIIYEKNIINNTINNEEILEKNEQISKKEVDKLIIEDEDINLEDTQEDTQEIENNLIPKLELDVEFKTPIKINLANDGWEDGLFVSQDGLYLYATYIPADMLSFVLNGDEVENYEKYSMGPKLSIDFESNPVGASYPWYHSELIYAKRDSINQNFSEWKLSSKSRSIFSEGAPELLFGENNEFELMAFTSNDKHPTYDTDIWIDYSENQFSQELGIPITINTNYNEDNPDLFRINDEEIILFFDSDNNPNNVGSHDIFFSISKDNGKNWSEATNQISINTNSKEHQPHLYENEKGEYYLYYSAYNDENKLSIFRVKQKEKNNWNDWENKELVISPGDKFLGLGEPTLTKNGDLYFVLVEELNNSNEYNNYDSDPWFIEKIK